MVSTSKVDKQGRIMLPSSWRRDLGIGAGAELVVTIDGDRLILETRANRIREAQRLVIQYATAGVSQVDELLRERREEARRERSP